MATRILLVEDDAHILDILCYYLEEAGYEVAAFHDPNMAVASFKDGCYDLAVLDVALKGMDGYGVAKEFRSVERLKDAPILFVSGAVTVPDALVRESGGKIEYLSKPIQRKIFLAKVGSLLESPA